MSEYDTEPVPGLPQNLPEGETLLWQGSPEPKAVARQVLHTKAVALYFAVLALVPLVACAAQGSELAPALFATARLAIVGAIAIAILNTLSRAIARTTIYSMTSKRLVMRYGVAFPLSLNIPFKEISAIDCKSYADGTADIALSVNGPLRMSYLHLWPHCRAWRFENAQPTLRVLPAGIEVAQTIASTMMAAGVQGAQVRTRAFAQQDEHQNGMPILTSAPA